MDRYVQVTLTKISYVKVVDVDDDKNAAIMVRCRHAESFIKEDDWDSSVDYEDVTEYHGFHPAEPWTGYSI